MFISLPNMNGQFLSIINSAIILILKLDVNDDYLCVWFNLISPKNHSFLSLISLIMIANMNTNRSFWVVLDIFFIVYLYIKP